MAYADLKADVIDWLIRDDLEAMVPQFIAMAEKHFNRVLRVPEMEDVAASVVTAGTVTLPTDFLEVRTLHVSIDEDTDYSITPEPLTIKQLNQYYAVIPVGPPKFYALQSGNELVLAPTPEDDTNASVVMNYYAKIPALSDEDPTNWLLDAHDDLYLAAALAEGFTYTRDTEQLAIWSTRRDTKLGELMRQGIKKAFPGSLRMRTQPLRQPYSNL